VPRPALSASRSSDIIDFLASFPDRGFTLSEIMRATNINVASCHAVLTTLVDCGYLTRSPDQPTYTLGPALIAIGHAAIRSQPLVARARDAAERLVKELGTPALLTCAIGKEIVAIFSLADASGRLPGLVAGERMPLVAPVGAPFVAWSTDAVIEEWIARRERPTDKKLRNEWRRTLQLTRSRGYQIIMRAPRSPTKASLMTEMAAGRFPPDYKHEMAKLTSAYDHELTQPEKIGSDSTYDVFMISSPLFDQNGQAAFNLSLGIFAMPLTGAMITNYADRLMQACLEIMRADRAEAPRRGRKA
jgi:DNA-binding IclR family transcriptional regulator